MAPPAHIRANSLDDNCCSAEGAHCRHNPAVHLNLNVYQNGSRVDYTTTASNSNVVNGHYYGTQHLRQSPPPLETDHQDPTRNQGHLTPKYQCPSCGYPLHGNKQQRPSPAPAPRQSTTFIPFALTGQHRQERPQYWSSAHPPAPMFNPWQGQSQSQPPTPHLNEALDDVPSGFYAEEHQGYRDSRKKSRNPFYEPVSFPLANPPPEPNTSINAHTGHLASSVRRSDHDLDAPSEPLLHEGNIPHDDLPPPPLPPKDPLPFFPTSPATPSKDPPRAISHRPHYAPNAPSVDLVPLLGRPEAGDSTTPQAGPSGHHGTITAQESSAATNEGRERKGTNVVKGWAKRMFMTPSRG